MRQNKMLGLAAWALGLILANALLFCLSRGFTPTFWITLGFVWAAFLSSLVFQFMLWKRSTSPDEKALHLPALTVSYAYLLVQFPICIIFALGSAAIPWKATLLVHTVLLVLAWIAAIGSLAGDEHIRKVNGRQKNYHKEFNWR